VINPGWGPRKVEIESGVLKGLHVVKCTSVFDADKRFNPQFDESNTRFFEGDMIVESIGQGMDLTYISDELKGQLTWNNRGRLMVDEYFQTAAGWLFAGGDIIQGPDVIHGIANGHKAAIGIDKYLNKP